MRKNQAEISELVEWLETAVRTGPREHVVRVCIQLNLARGRSWDANFDSDKLLGVSIRKVWEKWGGK